MIRIAEALARRGHDVVGLTLIRDPGTYRNVGWVNLQEGRHVRCDLLIAVQHPELLNSVPGARRRALWAVWPPFNIGRRWNLLRMWWHRPRVIFASEYQRSVYRKRLPSPAGFPVIPLGLTDAVRGREALSAPPPPRAIFASNPMRNLSWLIDLWSARILPNVPGAELHIFGVRDGTHRFEAPWEETFKRFGQFLPASCPPETLRSLKPHAPARLGALWDAMRASRVMLYGGHRA